MNQKLFQFLHILSNLNKKYFQHAAAKNKVLTAVSSKKWCNSVKMFCIGKLDSENIYSFFVLKKYK